MGYTNYWYRTPDLDAGAFRAAAADCAKVFAAARARGIRLVGKYDHQRKPVANGTRVAFNGEQGCEPFEIEREADAILRTRALYRQEQGHGDGRCFAFCKTERAPYDVVVQACLVALKYHLGEALCVVTDGGDAEWQPGFALAMEAGVPVGWEIVRNERGSELVRAVA